MDSIQLIKAASEIAENTKPAQEICLLWGDWQIQRWWSCMTKSEWSGWVQAIFSVLAILASTLLARWVLAYERRIATRDTLTLARHLAESMCAFMELAEEIGSVHGAVTVNTAFEGIRERHLGIRLDLLSSPIRLAVDGLINISYQANATLTRAIEHWDSGDESWREGFEYWKPIVKKHAQTIREVAPLN